MRKPITKKWCVFFTLTDRPEFKGGEDFYTARDLKQELNTALGNLSAGLRASKVEIKESTSE